MGSRDARCYLGSPEVVAASAAAGYITGPRQPPGGGIHRRFESIAEVPRDEETVEILEEFPARLAGRLLYLPQDNLNTDGIYGKDYTYREDMTPADMARVLMENYDPGFASRAQEGDIVVGGFNFGTGSSREQAVTALQAKGIPLVIAGSFSQTYLRNAFNNGFLCIESPGLVSRLREQFASEMEAGEKTVIPGEKIEVDFARSSIRWQGKEYGFPPMGRVPQALVAAGGVENLIRRSREPA
jgi:homoaconitate hydratase